MAGKLLKCTANLYTDSARQNKVGALPYYIGITQGNCTGTSFQNLSSHQYDFFTSRVADVAQLGGSAYKTPTQYFSPESKLLDRWFPNCKILSSALWQLTYYLELVFINGARMVLTNAIGSTGSWELIDKNGVVITSAISASDVYKTTPIPYNASTPDRVRSGYCTLVFDNIDSAGNIASDSNGAYYYCNATYGNDMWGGISTMSANDLEKWRTFFNDIAGYVYDPYQEAGESNPGGGDGDFDFSSTDIPIPSNPSIGAMDTGFISLYAPSAGQLKSLANYMWAGAFDVTQFKKLFSDPMDAILGLHIIPTISGHPATGSGSLLVGNIDTGLTMPTVTEQYYSADFGTVNIPAKWGAYLDYSPYTKLSLYLPYIGFVPISPDDCMRGSINVVYHVDILSGTCVAFVYCYSNRGADGHTLYIFNGSCSCDCPVTSGQYRSALEGLLGVAGSIGRVAAGDVGGGLKDAISNVTAMLKPEIGRSGSFGGAGGLMGIQYPYLVLTVPRMCIPGEQNTFIGYPSFVTKTIGDLGGYTSIDVSHLNNMPCTESETAEIISLLGEGVIL